MKNMYRHAGIGGTFDHFHVGHERLIQTAFNKADFVSIGVSTDDFVHHKKYRKAIQTFSERELCVKKFLQKNHWLSRSHLFKLTDIYGTAITDQTIDTLIVTKETRPNALRINKIRKQHQLPICRIVTIPFIKDSTRRIIRSTSIREGSIDRDGQSYFQFLNKKNRFILPQDLRDSLREPLGTIIPGQEDDIELTGKKAAAFLKTMQPLMIIAVGDIATLSLKKAHIHPDVSVIDFKTRRTQLVRKTSLPTNGYILNPAGVLCRNAIRKISQSIATSLTEKTSQQIVIRGEEDLLTLPAILLAPLGSAVVYGQYAMGIIVVWVDEAVKKKVTQIIEKFD